MEVVWTGIFGRRICIRKNVTVNVVFIFYVGYMWSWRDVVEFPVRSPPCGGGGPHRQYVGSTTAPDPAFCASPTYPGSAPNPGRSGKRRGKTAPSSAFGKAQRRGEGEGRICIRERARWGGVRTADVVVGRPPVVSLQLLGGRPGGTRRVCFAAEGVDQHTVVFAAERCGPSPRRALGTG